MKLLFIKYLRKIILYFFSILLFVGILFSAQLIKPSQALAADGCRYSGQCVDNVKCICPDPSNYTCYNNYQEYVKGDQPCGSAIIGGVEAPLAISKINSASGSEVGLIFFISRAINFANVVAGILVMINFVYVGFLYITGAGNASNMTKMNEKLTWSFVGIIMIVSSYTLAAIFGLVFYGDPTFIIAPTFTGALELQ